MRAGASATRAKRGARCSRGCRHWHARPADTPAATCRCHDAGYSGDFLDAIDGLRALRLLRRGARLAVSVQQASVCAE
jgi:hypothetical protein